MLPTNGKITQDFYKPVDYIPGRTRHEALDIVTNGNQIIYALGNGVVTKVIDGKGYLPNKGYGNEIWIQYDNGILSRAAHCAIGIIAKVGQRVVEGQRVAYTGATGYRQPLTVIHVHYETMINGVRVDPMTVDYGSPKPIEKPIESNKIKLYTYMDTPLFAKPFYEKYKVVYSKKEASATYWIMKTNDKDPREVLFEIPREDFNAVLANFRVAGLEYKIPSINKYEEEYLKGLTKAESPFSFREIMFKYPGYLE